MKSFVGRPQSSGINLRRLQFFRSEEIFLLFIAYKSNFCFV